MKPPKVLIAAVAIIFAAFFIIFMRPRLPKIFRRRTTTIKIGEIEKASGIKKSECAGKWYTNSPAKLKESIQKHLQQATSLFPPDEGCNTRALIVPHAAHKFSGLCATTGYTWLKSDIKKIILLGLNHSKSFDGVALPDFATYKTPIGKIDLDVDAISSLSQNSLFRSMPDMLNREHSIEIQLPLIQSLTKDVRIIPLIVGNLDTQKIERAAHEIGDLIDEHTAVIASSDLTHHGKNYDFQPFQSGVAEKVRKLDAEAIETISSMSRETFEDFLKNKESSICGTSPIRLLLEIIQQGHLGKLEPRLACYYQSPQIVELGNADLEPKHLIDLVQLGIDDSLVSYASIAFKTAPKKKIETKFPDFSSYEKQCLIRTARETIEAPYLHPFKTSTTALYHSQCPSLRGKNGVFVTLKKNDELRGCTGTLQSPNPLHTTISHMALSAAIRDNRFEPVKQNELDDITIEISVLSTPEKIKSYKSIKLGTHGILLEKDLGDGKRAGAVFLPKVPINNGWSIEETLTELSKKAKLAPDAWKKGCKFKVFETINFAE
ncbi:AmmeMemoRadiSam system protein B [bacterium]|nr:AmmeMemoRadiSam system protein B [bacterium]